MIKNKKSFHFHLIIIIIINFLNVTLINSQWDMQAQDLTILLSQKDVYIYSYSTGIFLSLIGIILKFILQNFLSSCINKYPTGFKIVVKIIQSFTVSILVGSIYYHTMKDSFFSEFTQPITSYYIFILSISLFYILRQSIQFVSSKNIYFKSQKCKNVHYHIKTFSLPAQIIEEEQCEDNNQFIKSKSTKNQFNIQTQTDKTQNLPESQSSILQYKQDHVKNYSESSSIKQQINYYYWQVILRSLEYVFKGIIIGTVFSTGHQKHYIHNVVAIFLYEVSKQLRQYYNMQKDQQFLKKQSNTSNILQSKYLNFLILFGVILSTHPYLITKLIFQYVLNVIAAFYIVLLGQFQVNCFKIQTWKDFLILIPQAFCIFFGTLTMLKIQDAQPIQQDHWHIYSPSYYKF